MATLATLGRNQLAIICNPLSLSSSFSSSCCGVISDDISPSTTASSPLPMKGQGPKLQGQENAPNIKTLTESKVTIKRKSAIIASIAMGRNRKLFCLYSSSSSSSSQISCFPFNTTTGRLVKSCTDLVGQSTLETGIHENQKMKLVESNTEVLVDDISGK